MHLLFDIFGVSADHWLCMFVAPKIWQPRTKRRLLRLRSVSNGFVGLGARDFEQPPIDWRCFKGFVAHTCHTLDLDTAGYFCFLGHA